MQVRLARSSVRTVSRLALVASVPFIAGLAFSAPEAAFAACGVSHPTGIHTGSGTGVHTAASKPAMSGGGGGCASGVNTPAPHGLSVAASGRVLEGGAHPAARTATHARTAAKKSANASARLRGVKPAHHP